MNFHKLLIHILFMLLRQWYADLETRGELKLMQTAATSLTSAGINSGGTIILLHEQDRFGGE